MQLQNVSFSHGKKSVLKNVTATFCSGEICALIGANGSGKTTLLRLLIGSLKPDAGAVMVNQVARIHLASRQQAEQMAYVPQETLSFFPYSVEELIRLGTSHKNQTDEIDGILRRFDLEVHRHQNTTTLSGGQRQRAHIARALAQKTAFVLLDEPTAHLDIAHQETLIEVLQTSARQETIGFIVAMHDLYLAAQLADRLILLHEGQILAEGTPSAVLTSENLKTAYGTDALLKRDLLGKLPL